MKEWRKVKTITVFIVLACMLLISACNSTPKSASGSQASTESSSTAEQPKSQPEQSQTQAQTQAPASTNKPQVTVTPPAGWSEVPGSTAIAQYMKGTCSFIVTCDLMPSDAKTPDTFTGFAKEQFSKVFDGVTFQDPKSVTIDGIEGRMMGFTCKISNMEMAYTVYYAFKDGRAYTFTCGGLLDEFNQLKGDYDAFLSSVKIN